MRCQDRTMIPATVPIVPIRRGRVIFSPRKRTAPAVAKSGAVAAMVEDTVAPMRLMASKDRVMEKRGCTRPLIRKIHMPGFLKYSGLNRKGARSQKIRTQPPMANMALLWESMNERLFMVNTPCAPKSTAATRA